MKHKLESRLPEEISAALDMQMIHPNGRNWRGTKEPLEESEKTGWKRDIEKTKVRASSPITSRQIDGETMGTVRGFIFLGSKITADGDCCHEI